MSDPRAQTIQYIHQRLADPGSQQARSVQLRPSLSRIKDELVKVVSGTTTTGGNSSLLIIGEPGVGKSLAVELALAEVAEHFNPDPSNPAVGVVRLDGGMHVNDRTTFQEIARQLCHAYHCPFSKAAAYAENLVFLRDILKALKKLNRTTVFVLDNVDQYTLQSKQTLLYNLLDALQATSNSAVVLGISRSQDMHETMEKRAYSRFSNRRLVVLNLEAGDSPQGILEQQLLLPPTNGTLGPGAQFVHAFNMSVKAALAAGMPAVQRLNEHTELQACLPSDMTSIASAAVLEWCCSTASTMLQPHHVEAALEMWCEGEESQAFVVSSLSVVELYCLVSMSRLESRGLTPFNFEMMWDELQPLSHGRFFSQDQWPKPTLMRCFQRVLDCGLATYVGARTGRLHKLPQYEAVTLHATQQDVEKGLSAHPQAPRLLRQWLRSEDLAPADIMS